MNTTTIKGSAVAIAAAAVIVCGCQKDSLRNDEGTSLLKFAPEVEELIGGEPYTKGSLVTGTALSLDATFYVSAWEGTTHIINPYSAVKYFTTDLDDGDGAVLRNMWNTCDNDGKIVEYTWKSGAEKTFYAYSNLPSSGSSVTTASAASQVLSYTVPADAADQKDILMGTYTGDGSTGNPAKQSGTASIMFKHALAAVQFKAGELDRATVNKISIEGVYSSASVTMNQTGTMTWSGQTESSTVTQTVTSSEKDKMLGEVFFLIPQKFDTGTKARIKVDITSGGKDISLYYPLEPADPSTPVEWKAGNCVTYTISYKKSE